MATFKLAADFETGERAGAAGTFQIDTLYDGNDNVITNEVDTGKHFNDYEDLKKYLSGILNIPVEEIEIENADD